MNILSNKTSFAACLSTESDPPSQFLQFKKIKVSPTVNTSFPRSQCYFCSVVVNELVTSLIAWSRFLPPPHVATKLICPAPMYFREEFLEASGQQYVFCIFPTRACDEGGVFLTFLQDCDVPTAVHYHETLLTLCVAAIDSLNGHRRNSTSAAVSYRD